MFSQKQYEVEVGTTLGDTDDLITGDGLYEHGEEVEVKFQDDSGKYNFK